MRGAGREGSVPRMMGKKNQAESYNELGDRHTYALNKYCFGTLFVRQWGNTGNLGRGEILLGLSFRKINQAIKDGIN